MDFAPQSSHVGTPLSRLSKHANVRILNPNRFNVHHPLYTVGMAQRCPSRVRDYGHLSTEMVSECLLTLNFEATRGQLVTCVNPINGQVTKMTPELTPYSPNYHTMSTRGS
ncbi:hypothetical protein TNCV_987481 [Trichonephila clavipes]|nr:hypothetical protein TNCV_987481 [Trichonephila clavipes]